MTPQEKLRTLKTIIDRADFNGKQFAGDLVTGLVDDINLMKDEVEFYRRCAKVDPGEYLRFKKFEGLMDSLARAFLR